MITTTSIILIVALLVVAALAGFVYFTFFHVEPEYISDHEMIVDNVAIQPAQAVELAKPYLSEHATYSYREDKELKIHLVRHKDWYYVMKTNYPAKTAGYYMQPAVKIHVHSGEIAFSKK